VPEALYRPTTVTWARFHPGRNSIHGRSRTPEGTQGLLPRYSARDGIGILVLSAHAEVELDVAFPGTRGPESTKITAEHSPQDLFSAFCQVGSLLVELPTRASHAALGFLLRFVMRFSLLSGFGLGASHHS
jgi:hypothetical protein